LKALTNGFTHTITATAVDSHPQLQSTRLLNQPYPQAQLLWTPASAVPHRYPQLQSSGNGICKLVTTTPSTISLKRSAPVITVTLRSYLAEAAHDPTCQPQFSNLPHSYWILRTSRNYTRPTPIIDSAATINPHTEPSQSTQQSNFDYLKGYFK